MRRKLLAVTVALAGLGAAAVVPMASASTPHATFAKYYVCPDTVPGNLLSYCTTAKATTVPPSGDKLYGCSAGASGDVNLTYYCEAVKPLPIRPRLAKGHFNGLRKDKVKLGFTLHASSKVSKLHSFVVVLPKGFKWVRKDLKKHVKEHPGAHHLSLSHGNLVVKLTSARSLAVLKTEVGAIRETPAEKRYIKHHKKLRSVTVKVKVHYDSSRTATLRFKIKHPH